jgi:hypothetical protein
MFPLSRDIGLIMVNHLDAESKKRALTGETDHEIDPTAAFSKLFNISTLEGSFDWVFAHPEDTALIPDDDDLPSRPRPSFNIESISNPPEDRGASKK